MAKVVLSTENYYSKFGANIWQYTENHVLSGHSEHNIQQSKLNKPHARQLFHHTEINHEVTW